MAFKNAQKSEIDSIIKKIKNGKLEKKDVAYIIDFVKSHKGVEAAEIKANEFVKNAITLLESFDNQTAKNALIDFSNFVVKRDK
jgi:octaprenyl-diphosphate synthase